MRLLGLDVGQKNIGVAVGETLSAELTTINAPKGKSFYGEAFVVALDNIRKLLELEEADALVVGLPVNEDGEPTEESQKIKGFAEKIGAELDLKVHFVDETLTSFMAEDILQSQDVAAEEIPKRVHQVAAQLILQQYLEESS
jgi:putative Holliday junction resolvase